MYFTNKSYQSQNTLVILTNLCHQSYNHLKRQMINNSISGITTDFQMLQITSRYKPHNAKGVSSSSQPIKKNGIKI
jgi:uncharacterized pyridoxamine 5'-phosphate oxidase family protein